MPKIDTDDAGDRNNPPPRVGRLLALLALAFVVTGVTAFVIPLVSAASDPAAAPVLAVTARIRSASPSVIHSPSDGLSFFCVEEADKPHCDRYVTDLMQRVRLDPAEQKAAQSAQQRIDTVMPPGRDGPCEYDEAGETCSMEILPPTAGHVRRVLDKAGFSTTVIRAARNDDPAPVSSLLLAVPIGRACVVSYVDGNGPHSWTTGQLPGGVCLYP